MKILDEEITRQITEIFSTQLVHAVELIYFSNNIECESCEDTLGLLKEITSLSEKLHLTTYDLENDSELAQKYHISRAPGLVIASKTGEHIQDYGIQFSGIPSGYEFSSLIQGVIQVSKRDSGLKPEVRQGLKKISKPVHLQVFVTPT